MLVRAVRQGQVTSSSNLSIDICTGPGNTCVSTITRYVWAGDQVLWELRAPGADGQNLESTGDAIYPAGQAHLFGQVSYLHAGGIDRPLTIWKRNVGTVRPHQNWRGLFSSGTWGTSSVQGAPPVGTTANCVTVNVNECLPINWPGERTTAWHESRGGESALWMGGLVDGMRDPTGQVYMRNRYYNPQTGQFTQMDPIGLAGGLNAYGFAAGDPVSFSDPYGLSGCNWIREPMECAARQLQHQMNRRGHNLTITEARYYVKNPEVMGIAAYVVKETGGFVAEIEEAYPNLFGVANAARHQYGQCRMTVLAGAEIAKTTADLHEAEREPGNEDTLADQENNVRGRAMGSNYAQASGREVEADGLSRRYCARVVQQNIENGNYSWGTDP